MKTDIKFVKPEEISLDTLIHIQEGSFDKVYLEECSDRLRNRFGGSSFEVALYNNSIIAYCQYLALDDEAFEEVGNLIRDLLKWREGVLSKNPDLTELIQCCRNSSGLPVDEHNIDMKAFPGEVYFDESKDIYSAELAVLPEYRRKGIATDLVRKLKENIDGNIFSFNKVSSAMHKLNAKLGGKPLFQFGPVLKDGTSLVLWVK